MDLTREQFYDRHLHYQPGVVSIAAREIQYIDIQPKPLKVQVPLVTYFERMKRYKADNWQQDFCERLQSAAENRHIERFWAMFHAEPQLGKTTIMSQCFPAWLFGHDPLFRFALAMYNQKQAEKHSKVIIQLLNDPKHRDMFPSKDGWLASEKVPQSGWMTRARKDLNDGQYSLNPVGLISGLTGSGFDWLSMDDPYRSQKDAFSETINESMHDLYEYTIVTRAGPYSCITGMFHRYAPEDFAGFLLDTGDYDYIRYASEADGDYVHENTGQRFKDPLDRKPGEYISERRKASYYTKARKNKRSWLALFQGRPSSEEGDFFNVGKIKLISPAEAEQVKLQCVAIVRAYDNAATEDAGAYSVGPKMGIRADGRITVFHTWRDQVDSAGRLRKQAELAESDGTDVPIRIPQDPGSAGKFEAWATTQHLEGYTVIARPVSGSKEDRAFNYSAAVNAGLVEFVDDPDLPEDEQWIKAAKKEMRDFPLSENKDIVDSMSDGYNYLYEVFRKGKIVKNLYPQRNLIAYDSFATRFPHEDGLKVPATFTIYIGIKITADASLPNSAVIVARAPQNTDLGEVLFILAEYKKYTSDLYDLFAWVNESLAILCEKPKASIIWLHPDSEEFKPVIFQKLRVPVRIFDEDEHAGLSELNWYLLPTDRSNPFNTGENASRLYGLIDGEQFVKASDSMGLYSFRQEAATWGYDDKGQPSMVGAVLDCLRMITYAFKTFSKPLTKDEKIERSIPKQFRLDTLNEAKEKGEISEEDFSRGLITRQRNLTNVKILSGSKKPKGRFSKFKK